MTTKHKEHSSKPLARKAAVKKPPMAHKAAAQKGLAPKTQNRDQQEDILIPDKLYFRIG